MKFIPLLFSTPMVQATLDELKTNTRRTNGLDLVNEDPSAWQVESWDNKDEKWNIDVTGKKWVDYAFFKGNTDEVYYATCPYGRPGDVLYVREMHYRYGKWVNDGVSKKTGKQKWKFVPDKQFTEVKYFDNPPSEIEKNTHRGIGWYKRNSLFMPKSATRLFLLNEGVKVERLYDISPDDAVKEGINYWNVDAEAFEEGEFIADYENYMWRDDESYEDYFFPTFSNPVSSFFSLWEKINGKKNLDANPWVCAITFKKIERPAGFLTGNN